MPLRGMKRHDGVVFDVLPLQFIRQLHAAYGDDLFYSTVDWYTEGKRQR